MRESLDISTQLTQVTEVDVTRVVPLRARLRTASLLARAQADLPPSSSRQPRARSSTPHLNASMTEDYKQITYGSENIAIAV